MGLATGYYSINDIKSLIFKSFEIGDFIETIMYYGEDFLRLRYKILSLERNGAVCLLIEQEWVENGFERDHFRPFDVRRFIHEDYFKYFKQVL